MQEDIKVIVTADTTQAEKQIDKMNGKEVEVKTKLKVPKNHLQEVKNEVDLLGKKVADIKMNKKAFSPEDIKILKAEIEATALKAKAIYFGEGSRSAKEMVDRLKEMHKALAEGKKQAKETNQIFGSMDVMIGSLKAKIVMNIVNTLKQGVAEGAKLAGQLEYATEKIRTISTGSRGVINSEIERIGKKYGTDYREVSEGLYQVVSAIGDVHKKYALLETANKLAITGFSSVNESVDGLTTVLNAYNLEIEEAERVANVFVRTQKVGKLTVQEFQQQLYKTVPTAKELGITIEEIGASIALLTAKGSKAEVAQTQMGALMYELLDTTSDVNKLFTRLAGQSIDTYMKNGGNLEGILRTLKEYSNQSGFKIESLFGRKEAKSFWLNV
ncbi:MAG: phage tail tape measure protein [Fusobacterium varium]|nr:phage tail tape measure protein [Fusobacterium varium]